MNIPPSILAFLQRSVRITAMCISYGKKDRMSILNIKDLSFISHSAGKSCVTIENRI